MNRTEDFLVNTKDKIGIIANLRWSIDRFEGEVLRSLSVTSSVVSLLSSYLATS